MRDRFAGLVAGLALLVALGAAPTRAAVVYWAFGDSITRGEGAGIAFDRASGTSCSDMPYPTKCAYHWRLEASLSAAGINADSPNRGAAAEKTGQGLSRIDNAGEPLAGPGLCADPDGDDVLLLMEGTNDVSNGVSVTSIAFNLGEMIRLATADCVHSAIATTIRRLEASEPAGSVLGDPDHKKTRDLKDAIIGLAAAKNRAYVDPYQVLCPNQACYGTIIGGDDERDDGNHFHPKFAPGDPGHLNTKGYDVMAPLFHDVIVAEPLPQSPAPGVPSGDVTETTPFFSWPALSRADWYFLQVETAGGAPVYGWWHPEEGHAGSPTLCSVSTCSFNPGVALTTGDYRWRVKARNLRGNGPWSDWKSFTVWEAPPAQVTLGDDPAGDIYAGTPYSPTYEWNSVADATGYELRVEDGSGSAVVSETYGTGVCAGFICSATPSTGLAAGDFVWRVRASNPAGPGPWSSDQAFTVDDSAPAAPIGFSPLEDVYDTTPTYRWSAVAGATSYDVRVDGTIPAALDGLDPTVVCAGSLCQVEQPTALAVSPPSHSWRVRGSNDWGGDGAESQEATFDVLDCSDTSPVELPDTPVVSGAVSESACGELRAVAGYVIGPDGDVSFHSGTAIVLGNGFGVQAGGAFKTRVE